MNSHTTRTLFKPALTARGPEDDIRNRFALNQEQWRECWRLARIELLELLPQFPDKFPEELLQRFPGYFSFLKNIC
jgi:hypothetical protein